MSRSDWNPEPAELREGESTDEETHARRNLEQIRLMEREQEDDE